jgi:hypothetical protein
MAPIVHPPRLSLVLIKEGLHNLRKPRPLSKFQQNWNKPCLGTSGGGYV